MYSFYPWMLCDIGFADDQKTAWHFANWLFNSQVRLNSSPSFSTITLTLDLASTFSLNSFGQFPHRCMGKTSLGFIAIAATAAFTVVHGVLVAGRHKSRVYSPSFFIQVWSPYHLRGRSFFLGSWWGSRRRILWDAMVFLGFENVWRCRLRWLDFDAPYGFFVGLRVFTVPPIFEVDLWRRRQRVVCANFVNFLLRCSGLRVNELPGSGLLFRWFSTTFPYFLRSM